MKANSVSAGFSIAFAVVLATLSAAGCISKANAVPQLPTGFELQFVVGEPFTGQPVGSARLPDGRVLLIERPTGVVRLAAVGATSSVAIATIPNVNGVHLERGLLGVTVDPEWPTRPYLYFLFNSTFADQRILMFTASGALTDPASTALTLQSPYLLMTGISDVNGIHNAGTLRFGPDGMLYVSLGDDGLSCPAQVLDEVLGGMLRLDVSSFPGVGSGPPPRLDLAPIDNPFFGSGTDASLRYAWGLRNPFRFTVDAPTGDVIIADVGSSFFEEINIIPAATGGGQNFGWPKREGFQEIFCCELCVPGGAFTDPDHVFAHLFGVTSLVTGPVLRNTGTGASSFPTSYEGDLLYFEVFSGAVQRLRHVGGSWALAPPALGQPDSANWATGITGVTDVQLGPEGTLDLVVLGITDIPRGFYRIVRTAATAVPEATPVVDAPEIRVFPNPARVGAELVITTETGRGAVADILIRDVRGRIVRRLLGNANLPLEGRAEFRWNGTDASGQFVAPGIYFAESTGSPSHGSARFVLLR